MLNTGQVFNKHLYFRHQLCILHICS